jgi:hypothetical protein
VCEHHGAGGALSGASPARGLLRCCLLFGRLCSDRGSVLLLVLFICVVMAVVVQTLAAVALCADHSLQDELTGRARMSEKEWTLGAVRESLLYRWAPFPATSWEVVGDEGVRSTQGWAQELPDSEGWLMRASAKQEASLSLATIFALAERGRDGVDLPVAAVVAGTLSASVDRGLLWLDNDRDSTAESLGSLECTPCYFVESLSEPLLGARCVPYRLRERWHLDPGWRRIFKEMALGQPVMVAEGEGVWCLSETGGMCTLSPEEGWGRVLGQPVLAVLTGGANLDARDLGDFYGVIVVDEGSVLLDGTTVHGAVFVTDSVDLGKTGRVLYSRKILRWATDRSLHRVRLVPGTRSEMVE